MRLKTVHDVLQSNNPGDWAFHTDDKYIIVSYPVKSSYPGEPDGVDVVNLPIKPEPNGWTWDGNKDAPTLTPSILVKSNGTWHGYLTAGKLITL